MKQFLLLLTGIFCLSINSQASHVIGGDITYRYIGDSTGVAHQYEVYLALYRDSAGIDLPFTAPICVTSSCYGATTISAQAINNNTSEAISLPCQSSSLGTKRKFYRVRYKANTILPGTCSEYTFSYATCCRNSNFDNLQSSATTFRIRAELDNTKGPNSTGTFSQEGAKQACLNSNTISAQNWDQGISNPDGDSIFYTFDFSTPQVSNCGNTPSPITFNQGYSSGNPISSSNGFVTFTNGVIQFTPYKIENAIVRVGEEEWRKDTLNNTMYRVGYSVRESYLIVSNSCRQDSFSTNDVNLVSSDTSTQFSMPSIWCNDQVFGVELNKPFMASSITPSGSEFRLTNSLGQAVPIAGATVDSNQILIQLYAPAAYNDTLTLNMKAGNDGNTILMACGPEIPPFSSQIRVVSCTTSVGKNEFLLPEFSLYPNPGEQFINIEVTNAAPGQFTITDLQGRVIRQGSFSELKFKLDISQLSRGSYLLHLKQGELFRTQKFSKL